MRSVHVAVDLCGIGVWTKRAHVPRVLNQPQGNIPMFVRAVWRLKRLVDIKQTLREMDVPSTRDADLLGLTGPDFTKMTRSLFDR